MTSPRDSVSRTARDAFPRTAPGSKLEDDRHCFACGPDNPHGLRLRFEYGDGTARCIIPIDEQFAGWAGILHGGIVATLLDEAMAHATLASGVRAVTGKLEVRFRKAAPIGVPLALEGKVVARRGKMLEAEATLAGPDGTVYAEGHSRFLAV